MWFSKLKVMIQTCTSDGTHTVFVCMGKIIGLRGRVEAALDLTENSKQLQPCQKRRNTSSAILLL